MTASIIAPVIERQDRVVAVLTGLGAVQATNPFPATAAGYRMQLGRPRAQPPALRALRGQPGLAAAADHRPQPRALGRSPRRSGRHRPPNRQDPAPALPRRPRAPDPPRPPRPAAPTRRLAMDPSLAHRAHPAAGPARPRHLNPRPVPATGALEPRVRAPACLPPQQQDQHTERDHRLRHRWIPAQRRNAPPTMTGSPARVDR